MNNIDYEKESLEYLDRITKQLTLSSRPKKANGEMERRNLARLTNNQSNVQMLRFCFDLAAALGMMETFKVNSFSLKKVLKL